MNDKNELPAQPKVWGETTAIFRGNQSEVHYLTIKAGGFSSCHRHRKINLFFVVTGTLLVEMAPLPFGEPDFMNLLDLAKSLGPDSGTAVQVLTAGQTLEIKPNFWHRFRAATDCQVIEVYWMPEIDPGDIERANVGGLEPFVCTCNQGALNEWCMLHGERRAFNSKLVHF